MMATLFEKLQFNFSGGTDVITEFSPEVTQSLNTTPSFLPEWGYNDMLADDDNSYVTNPMEGSTSSIINICNSMTYEANVANNQLSDLMNASTLCSSTATGFRDHTRRIAGTVEINSTTALLPHYDTAMGIGKALTHIVYQADGYANTAVVLGSFTSLLIEDELQNHVITISSYPATINSSMTYDGNTATSNLSNTTVNTMISSVLTINTLLADRKWHDENFFNQSKSIVSRFENVKRYTSMGATDDLLVRNYLSTQKLKDRI